jgi:chromosome segregation ATPase
MHSSWRTVCLLGRLALAIGSGWAPAVHADEVTDRLKLTALTEEGGLLLDEADALQPMTDRLAREGEQLDQIEPKLREESAALDAAIAKFNGQNKDLERAVQEHRQRCPRESEDKALVESCNAMAAGLQSVAQQLEQERPRLHTRQQELKARIEQHNGVRREWAMRKRDHDARLQANRTDSEPWLTSAKSFLASDSMKANLKKAGDPAQCKAAAPAELTGVGPAEAVRRVQACLKALAAVPVPAKEVR